MISKLGLRMNRVSRVSSPAASVALWARHRSRARAHGSKARRTGAGHWDPESKLGWERESCTFRPKLRDHRSESCFWSTQNEKELILHGLSVKVSQVSSRHIRSPSNQSVTLERTLSMWPRFRYDIRVKESSWNHLQDWPGTQIAVWTKSSLCLSSLSKSAPL